MSGSFISEQAGVNLKELMGYGGYWFTGLELSVIIGAVFILAESLQILKLSYGKLDVGSILYESAWVSVFRPRVILGDFQPQYLLIW